MQAITRYLEEQGYATVADSYYTQIERWLRWYKGSVPSVHNYRQFNGRHKVSRTRKGLGMAKKIAEDWACLCLNERVEIIASAQGVNDAVWEVLNANKFRERGNQLIELAFALGTGAFVEYTEGARVFVDYIRAGMIYPLAWDNNDITDCAFASVRKRGKDRFVYLNIHRRHESGFYVIENRMFKLGQGNTLTPDELPEGVEEFVETYSTIPRFQIIRPNIVNNVDLDCPMGISVFANAIDQLENCDIIFDSYHSEFRLGRKRIMVPFSMARMLMEESGATTPVFDDNDLEFYVYSTGDDAKGQKIDEINGELRYEAHEHAIATAINLCAYKCGFGENKYKFEQGAAKTATEVISEDCDMYRNLKKHELQLEGALRGLFESIASMLGRTEKFEVTINFDDSIIEDKAAARQLFMQEIREGLRKPWEYRVEYFGETEAQARAAIGNAADDDIMGFNKEGE